MNLNHRSSKILIVGASGTGKTTLLARYIHGIGSGAFVFVFDHQGDISQRLRVAPVLDYDGLVAALAKGEKLIVFDPVEIYQGDLAGGFEFFSDFVFTAGSEFDGRKIFVSDEIHLVTSTDESGLPFSFGAMLETGRRQEIDLALVSQAPNQCNTRIRNQATEIFVFNVALDGITRQFLQSRGFDIDAIPALAEGEFICRDVRRNLETRGRLFDPRKKVIDNRPQPPDIPPVEDKPAPPSEADRVSQG